MNTKSMQEHLKKAGVTFTKTEGGWKSELDGDLIAEGRQLGYLVWDTAKALGED